MTSVSNDHRLSLNDSAAIDLLPFHAYAEARGEHDCVELWQGPAHFVGLGEVAKNGLKTYEIGGTTIESATVPALIGLKLIALDDRPEMRSKDAGDIGNLIRYYPKFEDGNIWNNHNDLFETDVEWLDAGYIALGREIRRVFQDNESLCSRLVAILDKITSGSLIGLRGIREALEVEPDEAIGIINRVKQGLAEDRTNF